MEQPKIHKKKKNGSQKQGKNKGPPQQFKKPSKSPISVSSSNMKIEANLKSKPGLKRKRPNEGKDQGPKAKKAIGKTSSLQDRFKKKLESGQFRWLNEQLYTTTSNDALQLFQKEPELYDVYHRGFRLQVEKWPENPVDVIIQRIAKMPEEWVIGDFGCGEAMIAQTVKQKVHSFDLCKTNKFVTVANSANVPLGNGTLDVAVFCLSLMGVDYLKFLVEARRVLKQDSMLVIAEVKSRFGTAAQTQDDTEGSMLGGIEAFKKTLHRLGFQLVSEETSNKMFVLFSFKRKTLPSDKEAQLVQYAKQQTNTFQLKSCKYKKR